MRQAETAIQVFHDDIQPTLKGRQAFVERELGMFYARSRYWPTALELLADVNQLWQTRYDVNAIRPRLTELWGLHRVEHGEKRKCRVSGKTALTWALPARLF